MATKKLTKRVEAFLDSTEWDYEFDAAAHLFKTGVELDGPLGALPTAIVVSNDYLESMTFYPKPVPAERRVAASEYLMRVNYRLRTGSLRIDFDEGSVACHTFINCEEGYIPNDPQLKDLLFSPIFAWETYGEGLLDVIAGTKTPAEAYAEAEGKVSTEVEA